MRRFGLGVLILIFCLSCGKVSDKGIYDQGRIEYRISYLNAEEDDFDPSFLPKKMILEFNQEYSINHIVGFMGFFKLDNITYFRNKKVETHLKVLDQNYAFKGGRNELMCCFDCMDNMIVEEDTSDTILAGLKSHKVSIRFADSNKTYDIYYTNDISLNKPNLSNPYSRIEGVLTQFQLVMGPYHMQFTATKFDPERPPKEELDIPEDAVDVKRGEMVAILNRLMEQNM